MKRKIVYTIIITAVIISAFFIGKSRGKSEMISQFYDAMNNSEYIVDMSEVTSFTANGNSLQLYFMGKLKYDAIRIAKQLCYKAEIISRIQNAKSESEIYRILKTAREEL